MLNIIQLWCAIPGQESIINFAAELRNAFALWSEAFRAHVRKLARHGREAVEPHVGQAAVIFPFFNCSRPSI